MEKLSKNELRVFAILIVLMVGMTLLTKFEGGADIYDYSDTAKFFSGKYDAKIRTSHSYLYGLIHTPFVWLFENFLIFKVTSLLSLFLIIYSVYILSGKDKKSLWLIVLSPIIWYMAPWISPIQSSSLLFLWAWYFIKKYNLSGSAKPLFYSGVLAGLSWAFWDGILFFIPLFIVSFFYDRKLMHGIYFVAFVLIGTLPRIILDYALFGFPFFTPVRHIMASLALTFLGGFYEQGSLWGVGNFILLIVFMPVFTYLIFKKEIFLQDKKSAIFILLSVVLLIINSQIRFILLIVPIIILSVNKNLEKNKFIIQIIVSLVLILLVINPYLIQVKFDTGIGGEKGTEFESFIKNVKELNLNNRFERNIINSDIQEIVAKYQSELFVVGNSPDDYRVLANLYWGDNVKEFVSIEDYELHFSNNSIVAEKEICSNIKIKERRDICASVWIRKAFGDETDYSSIKYGISFDDKIELEGFQLVRQYERLSLFEKIN